MIRRNESRKKVRIIRKTRVSHKNRGTAVKPRISVFLSNTRIYAQVIDDASGKTIAHVQKDGKTVSIAKEIGVSIAELLKNMKIAEAVFDRSGNTYHGRVKALADAVREGGVKI